MKSAVVWRGAAAGAIGGAAGASTMVLFNHLLARAGFASDDLGRHDQHHRLDAKPNDSDATIADEPSTRQAASRASTFVTGAPLTEQGKDVWGALVHHAFGAASGAVYGALAARVPAITAGAGIPYGVALWFGAAEVGLPLAGLARHPRDYPPVRHVASLASHCMFGMMVEAVRRVLTRR